MELRKLLSLGLLAFMLSACGGSDDGGSNVAGLDSNKNESTTDSDSNQDNGDINRSVKPLVIAHRGASGYLPEHTLAAYELAIQMRADYIEPDLQFTRDGQLVVMHDDSLDRTTNVADIFPQKRGAGDQYRVSDFTLAEIKQLTVQPFGKAAASYPGFTPSMINPFAIPTFQEVLQFAKQQSKKIGRPVGVYPEAKQADPAMEDAILKALADNQFNQPNSPVFIQSFSDETIRNLHEKQKKQGSKMPQILLGAAYLQGNIAKMAVIAGGSQKLLDLTDVAQMAEGVGVAINYPGYEVTRSFIEQAHAAGLKVHGWTFNQSNAVSAQEEYRRYLDLGMDGIFSNYADLAVLARDQFNVQVSKISSGPLVIAHRGASGYLPEHTLAAYELAIQMNVDYIEPDLQFSSDGYLVAMHDKTLDRTTNVAEIFPDKRNNHADYPVSDFTLDEIRRLTVKPVGTASNSYPGYAPSMANPFRIPLFQEVIEFAQAQSKKYGRPIGIYPEAKQADPAMEDAILKALSDYGMNKVDSPVFIQSFSAETINSLRAKQNAQGTRVPQILLGYATMDNGVARLRLSGTFFGQTSLDLATVSSMANGVGLSIGTASAPVTKEFVDQAHAAGLKVHAWTFNKVEAIDAAAQYYQYLDMGIDGMFSNYPNLAVMTRNQLFKSTHAP